MMKLCICGKGGSGKSTVVKLMADAFRQHSKKVIVLDSDESNTGLYWMLGFQRPPRPLMDSLGGKKRIQAKMIERFSRGENEPEMSIWEQDLISLDLLEPDFMVEKGDIRLIQTGKIHQALEGCACPMGVVTREFLKKVELGPDDVMVVDMEAGMEHFGRGVETSIDNVVCAVEPSLESVNMASKVGELTQSVKACFKGALLNKVTSPEQEGLLFKKLEDAGVSILGTVHYHAEIATACLEGRPFEVPEALAEINGIVEDSFL
jgi:CO dehydrogenase maturation factor